MINFRNKGFSLIEVTIGLGVAAALGLLLMRQQETASKIQSKANINQEINSVASNIQAALSNRAVCSETLRGLKPGDEIGGIKDGVMNPDYQGDDSIPEFFTDSATPLFKKGPLSEGGIEISEMKLIQEDVDGKISDYVKVEFNLDPKGIKKMFGGKTVAKKFMIKGVVDPVTNTYRTCYSEQTNMLESATKRACVQMGGTWDESVAPATCKLTNLPQCMVTTEACNPNSRFSENKGSWEMMIKNTGTVTCVQHYNVKFLTIACKYKDPHVTRSCTCVGAGCTCGTGDKTCYYRTVKECKNEVVPVAVNNCCQKSDAPPATEPPPYIKPPQKPLPPAEEEIIE